jgi:hypothetical protein
MNRNAIHRESVIKHEKSKLGTPLSVFQVSHLALELSHRPDGTVGPGDLEQNFERAFGLLEGYISCGEEALRKAASAFPDLL